MYVCIYIYTYIYICGFIYIHNTDIYRYRHNDVLRRMHICMHGRLGSPPPSPTRGLGGSGGRRAAAEHPAGTHGYSHGTAWVLECVAAAARPRAVRAVLWCAGAYFSGAVGSNECPAGSVRIEAEAACRTAAAAAGKTFYFVVTDPIPPRGCYYVTSSNAAYFNTHPVGAGDSNRQLLCATGAPLPNR